MTNQPEEAEKGAARMPLIMNGKQPAEPLNILMVFPLPTHAQYGNLLLKFVKIIERLDHVNRRILQIQDDFKRRTEMLKNEIPDMTVSAPATAFTAEEIVASMRKVADELVTLLYLKGFQKENGGTYLQKLEVDSIGIFLHSEKPYLKQALLAQRGFLELLNSISNAHKHS